MSVVQRHRHRDLARAVASASFVLLKNMNNTLPIKSEGSNKTIVVSVHAMQKIPHHNVTFINVKDLNFKFTNLRLKSHTAIT